MEGVATVPVPIVCPAVVYVPPAGIISPIPGRGPCTPSGTPEPVVDDGSVNIHRFDDIVGAVYIFVTDYLYRHLFFLVFFYIDRGYILIDVFRQNGLQYDETFVALACLYNAQVIHLSVTVQVKVAERAVRVVEHHLELLQVFSFCKKLSYNLQIQSF